MILKEVFFSSFGEKLEYRIKIFYEQMMSFEQHAEARGRIYFKIKTQRVEAIHVSEVGCCRNSRTAVLFFYFSVLI